MRNDATRIAPTDIETLRKIPVGDFCAFQTTPNQDKTGIADVLIDKPELMSMPTLFKRETNRTGYVQHLQSRLTQEALVHRDILAGEFAKMNPIDKVLKDNLKALAKLQDRGLDLTQLEWSVGMEKPDDVSTTEWEKIRKPFRIELTVNARVGVRNLIHAFDKGLTFEPKPGYREICDLFAKGFEKTFENAAPKNPGSNSSMSNALVGVSPAPRQRGTATSGMLRPQPRPAQSGAQGAQPVPPGPRQTQASPNVRGERVQLNLERQEIELEKFILACEQNLSTADPNKLARARLKLKEVRLELKELAFLQKNASTQRPTATTTTTTTTSTTHTSSAHPSTTATGRQRQDRAPSTGDADDGVQVEEVDVVPSGAKVKSNQVNSNKS